MLHFDCADQIRNAPSGDGLKNGVFRNTARADSARAAKQASLHGVTSNLAGYATRPPDCWLVEAFALEPIGIAASGVHSRFHASAKCLPALIGGAQHSLAIFGARVMESELPVVLLVVLQPISGEAAFPLRLQRLQ